MEKGRTRCGIYAIVSIIMLMMAFSYSRADIAPMRETSGKTLTSSDKAMEQIEMSAEEVSLVLTKAALKVKVVFHMKNAGPELKIEEGFPMGYYSDIMKDFEIKSGGKKLNTEVVTLTAGQSAHNKPINDYWVTWKNTYPANSSVQVEVAYQISLEDYGPNEQSTGYILHTGAAWKGVIGKAVVTLTFGDGFSPYNLVEISRPDAAAIQKDKVVWVFKDLEPTEADDIVITFHPQDYSAVLKEYANGSKGWRDTQNFARRAKMHDRKAYWEANKKLLNVGERKDEKLILQGGDKKDEIEWAIVGEAVGIFHEALRCAQNEPEAKAFLPVATDLVELLLDGKVWVDNTKVWYAGIRKYGEMRVLKVAPNGGEYAKKTEAGLRQEIKQARELVDKNKEKK